MNIRTCWALLLCLPLASLAETATQREIRQAQALKPDQEHGREIFEQCAACHGPDGNGTTDGSVPRIAGQHYSVLVRQVINFRRGTRWDIRMEGVATRHEIIRNPQDIADVARHVSQLGNDGARGVGDGMNVARGAELYSRGCAACHGPGGEGSDTKEIPRLAGQHAAYLARQIYDAVDGRRPELTRSHGKRLESLDFEDVRALTDYLSRIPWKTEAAAQAP
jgi:cytochrome c553